MTEQPDGDHALALRPAAPPKLRLAESLADRKPGETVALDRRGEVIGRRRVRRLQVINGAATVAIVASAAVLFGPPGAIGGAVGAVVGALLRRRRYGKLRDALALVAAWRDDEARALLRELQTARARRSVRMSAERLLGVVAWRAGAHQEALDHVERALAMATPAERAGVGGDLMTVMRIQLLIELDVERARALLPELARAPATELFVNERRAIDLDLAFRRDRPDELPDDLELHDWARSALGDNAGGGRLGLLAWAFDRRGDKDMSALLLGEVESHLPVPLARLAPMVPRLHAWLAPRIAALPADDD